MTYPSEAAAQHTQLRIIFGLIIFAVIGFIVVWNAPPPPTAQEIAATEAAALKKAALDKIRQQVDDKEKAEFNSDYRSLMAMGKVVVDNNFAEKYDFSGWNGSLDLYLGTRSTTQAAQLSNLMCHGAAFKFPKLNRQWKVRVYLADQSVGAECRIRQQ